MVESRLFLAAAMLLSFGLLNVYSASMPLAMSQYGDALYFFRRQLVWAVLAVAVCLVTLQIPLEFWRRAAPVLFFAAIALLVAMPLLGLASVRNGAARWISFGSVSLQPSEFARPLFVLYLAKILSGRLFLEKPRASHFAGVIGVAAMLIVAVGIQPDFGGAVLLATVLLTILFVAGAPLGLLLSLVGVGFLLGLEVILSSAYKRGRLLAFLDPWSDADAYGFQLIQSYLALGNGGLFGTGIGLGGQKLFYLPEAHTDFIVSVIGEEYGLIGTLGLLALVGWFLYEIYRIGQRCGRDRFAQLVVVGSLAIFGCAYMINLSVATGLLPTKGLALPLLSYGGSALLASAFLIGLTSRVGYEKGAAA